MDDSWPSLKHVTMVVYMKYLKIPHGKIKYLLEISMAYPHAMDDPSETKALTIKFLLKSSIGM